MKTIRNFFVLLLTAFILSKTLLPFKSYSLVLYARNDAIASDRLCFNDKNVENCTSYEFKSLAEALSYFDITESRDVEYEGKTIFMQSMFYDDIAAIETVKKLCPDLLRLIRSAFLFDNINVYNVPYYSDKLTLLLSSNVDILNYEQEVSILQYFFDIYENKNTNDKKLIDRGVKSNLSRSLGFIGEKTTRALCYIGETKTELYSTYVDPEKAVDNVIFLTHNLLSSIARMYSLPMFSPDNCSEYAEALANYDIVTKSDALKFEYAVLNCFFDIYENAEKNLRIIELTESYNNSDSGINYELITLLPYDSEVKQTLKKQLGTSIIFEQNDAYAPSTAVYYAAAYAVNPNTSSYYYFTNGDCMNFTSQCLEAGGLAQIPAVVPGNPGGWWHSYSGGVHSHSLSWTVVDYFYLLFDYFYNTADNTMFSLMMYPGDAAIIDYNGDWDFNHAGFIAYTSTFNSELGYADYCIAQHTSNYLAYASTSTNNWELYDEIGIYLLYRF